MTAADRQVISSEQSAAVRQAVSPERSAAASPGHPERSAEGAESRDPARRQQQTAQDRKRFWRGVLCALVGGGLWGFSGACAQFLFAHYDIAPATITSVRMIGAGVLFMAVLLAKRRAGLGEMLGDRRTVGRLVVFGAGGLFLCQFTYIVTIGYTNAGTATVLQSTAIVFVMLFTCLFARKLPRARELAGLVLAAAATWLIATQGDPAALSLPAAGLAWGLANGLSCAFYIMYPRRLFAQYGSFAVTGVGMMVGGIASLAVSVPAGVPQGLDATAYLMLALIAVVGTFAAFGLYLHGVALVGSVKGSLLGAIEPVSATAFSALWLGTAFSGADWAGFALMIAMIFLVTGEKPQPSAEEAHNSEQVGQTNEGRA